MLIRLPSIPAGDVRQLGKGVTFEVRRSAFYRPDWAIYWSALAVAIGHGADLRIVDEV
jgi:hypothetical protein